MGWALLIDIIIIEDSIRTPLTLLKRPKTLYRYREHESNTWRTEIVTVEQLTTKRTETNL